MGSHKNTTHPTVFFPTYIGTLLILFIVWADPGCQQISSGVMDPPNKGFKGHHQDFYRHPDSAVQDFHLGSAIPRIPVINDHNYFLAWVS